MLDECDHIVQQQHFQHGLQCLLKDCPNISFLISTHQPIYQQDHKFHSFKNVHVILKKLTDEDAGKLFLRRLSRTITWADIGYSLNEMPMWNLTQVIRIDGPDPNIIYRKVAQAPYVAAAQGHPRKLIEAATKFL